MFGLINSAFAEGENAAAEATEAVEKAVTTAAKTGWFHTAFKKLGELPVWGWVLLAVLLAAGIAVIVRGKKSKINWSTRMLAMGAMCIALTCIFSRIRLYKMPQGGSITLASMLPLMMFSYVYGAGPGLIVGALYGIMDYLFGGTFLNITQFLLDYPIAFAMCGLAGFFGKNEKVRLWMPVGVVVSCVARWICSVISGVVFFADYAPAGMNPWVYSAVYNGTYMLPECAICVLVAVLVGNRLVKELKKYK